MKHSITRCKGALWVTMLTISFAFVGVLLAQGAGKQVTSYAPVAITEDFAAIMARMSVRGDCMVRVSCKDGLIVNPCSMPLSFST